MNRLQVRRLASNRSFARGQSYYQEGRVRSIAEHGDTLTAVVRGKKDYRIRLTSGGRKTEYSCDCPMGLDGDFCKHLVAASLAWFDSQIEGGKIGRNGKQPATADDLRAFLERQDKDALVAILASAAMENRNLHERLLLEAARSNPAGVDLTAYRRAIANAMRTNGFIDLSHPYSYLQIAEVYRDAGKYDKALAWAELGIKSFPQRDSRLVEFLAREYQRRHRHDGAMKLIWQLFIESPSLNNYHQLKAYALRVRPQPEWSAWRGKAMAHLREVIAKEKSREKRSGSPRPWFLRSDNSRIVEILFWEERYDEAWEEASTGGCSEALWLRLAAKREEKFPGDAVQVYKQMIAPTLSRTNNAAYAEAIELLRKIRELMSRLGREMEFEDYVSALRVEYKRKRNFIKLLEGL